MADGYTLLGFPIPAWVGDWITELANVRRGTRLTLIWIGFIAGLVVAALAVMAGLYLSFFA